ncbi:hypothetical protein EMIT0P43_60185 [Pseudomonas jessenii]
MYVGATTLHVSLSAQAHAWATYLTRKASDHPNRFCFPLDERNVRITRQATASPFPGLKK